MVDINFFEMVI